MTSRRSPPLPDPPPPPRMGMPIPSYRARSGHGAYRASWGLRLGLLAFILGGGFLLNHFFPRPPSPDAPVTDPLPQAAYVRERQWSQALRGAMRRATGAVDAAPAEDAPAPEAAAEETPTPPLPDGLSVLCAELGPAPGSDGGGDGGGGVNVLRPAAFDWALLAGLPRPVGLVIRVRAFPAANPEVNPALEPFPTLRRVLEETSTRAAAAGLRPAETLIDFDCPPARLAGYAAALETLRAAVPGQPLRPVARLPWLAAPEFPALARAAGGFILQAHGLDQRATKPDSRPYETLCDPHTANDAVLRAAALGVPFRVSLPAAGYRLLLDADGKLLSAASSEAVNNPPAAGNVERLLLPDAKDMASLVAEWSRERPANLRGILWDRLPVPGDRLDWPAATFAAVRVGRAPRGRLQWEFPPPVEGSDRRELALRNVGEAEVALPPVLTVGCPDVPLAVEASDPYEIAPLGAKEKRPPRDVRFRLRGSGDAPSTAAAARGARPPAPPRRTLAPGATLLFGAVRLPLAVDENAPGIDQLGVDVETVPP